APCAGPQQIRDEAGQLDVRFFQQRFQSIVQLHAVARDLVLAAHHRPPESLLGVGHKAQGELLGHQTLHQSFGIRKVPFAPAGATIGLRLRKVKGPGHGARSCARPAHRPPVLLQCLPRVASTARSIPSRLPRPHAQPASRRARAIGRGWSRSSAVQSGRHLRSRRPPPQAPTSSCARQSPRSGTASVSPRGSGERAFSPHSGSRAIAGSWASATTLNYSVNHARSGSNSCSASIAPWLISISPLPAPTFCPIPRFSFPFAGLQAQPQAVAKLVPDSPPTLIPAETMVSRAWCFHFRTSA